MNDEQWVTNRAMAKKGLVCLVVVLALAGAVFRSQAQSAQTTETLLLGNQLYEDGRFAEAAQTYQQLVDGGLRNATLYYNLGNAYFKQGDVGRAILNYERAARLAPRDADVRANLVLARTHAVDKYDTASASAVNRLVELARTWLTLNETAVLALSLWLFLGGLLLAYRHSGRGRRREGLQYMLILTALLLAGLALSLGGRLYLERVRPQAVILAEEINVMSGPGEQYITEFTLHSGAEVAVLETRGNWARLSLPGGELQGWAPEETLAVVNGE
ncbi:MAG: tetratricopeptide repeat protein [Anaerolineae bacterium]